MLAVTQSSLAASRILRRSSIVARLLEMPIESGFTIPGDYFALLLIHHLIYYL